MKNFDYKKSLGQNFLIDKNIISKISDSINTNEDDLIIEIGPGSGALTKELVKKTSNLICFEIDQRLKEALSIYESEKTTIVYNDFLKIKLSDYINKVKHNKLYFVGNLPYYITSTIINKIIEESNPEEIIVMVQKEVGERFMAHPKTKQYNSLSVFLQYNFEITKVCNVSKNCFEPIPKVDSVVVKLKKHKNYNAKDENRFYKLVKDSFRQKRKTIKNNLNNYDLKTIENVLKTHNKTLSSRAEEITIEQFVEIANSL